MSVKKLGFGLMRLPAVDEADKSKVDVERVCHLADRFLAEGFTYFDTAACYHSGNSEQAFREAVAKRYPREAYTITDKLSLFMLKEASEMPGFFEKQLENCGVEYFDYYLLHSLDEGAAKQAEEWGAFDFMLEKKAEGLVKHVGFSFHDKAEVLDKILTRHPEMEYVQLQLNYADWEDSEVQSRKCYEVCVKYGKSVLVMEPIKGGMLANVPAEAEALLKGARPEMSVASWAIRFAASQENVFMVLSGMSDEQQVEDNLSYMKDFAPLSDEEKDLAAKSAAIIKSKEKVPCTGCRYCTDGCPMKIAIPDYFKLLNRISMFGEGQLASVKSIYKDRTEKEGHGKASDCVGCRQCEEHCPQHLPITEYLEEAAKTFE